MACCKIAWCGIWCDVQCFAMPDVGCCALFTRVMWNKVRCRIYAIWCDAKCDVVQCADVLWNWCGDTMWNDSVVHGEYGGVLMQDVKLMWLWNTEWHGMVWRRIRHNGVMRNDGWNAAWRRYGMCGVVWNVGCGIVICNLYLNAMFMAWCEVECGPDVEWCAEMWWCDLMWIMVRCEMWCRMLQFQTWCDVECNRNTT